ncbi:MAG: SDR family NAD(P)-dependent oxidoreductase [Solirubrobacteraceae bacterium]
MPHTTERSVEGLVIVITGASDGIGAVAARRLHERGATVVPVGRSPEKTARVADALGVDGLTADFSSLGQVRDLALRLRERCPRIDVLANNAGGVFNEGRRITDDGHELTFQVNHLAPYLLTRLLEGRIAAAPRARVLQTASAGNLLGRIRPAHLDGTTGRHRDYGAYCTAKLLNVVFTRGLRAHYATAGIDATVASFHPGVVTSSFGRDSAIAGAFYRGPVRRLFHTPEQGAEPLVRLATHPDDAAIDGRYFHRGRADGPLHRQGRDDALARLVWDRSAAMVGLPA